MLNNRSAMHSSKQKARVKHSIGLSRFSQSHNSRSPERPQTTQLMTASGNLIDPNRYSSADHQRSLIEMSKHVTGAYGQYGVIKNDKSLPHFS